MAIFAIFRLFWSFWAVLARFPRAGPFSPRGPASTGQKQAKNGHFVAPPGGPWGLLEPSRILRLVRKEMAARSRNAGQGRFWSKWSFWTLRG